MTTENVKIQIYCPQEYQDTIRLAIGNAGGGAIGKYSFCCFISTGQGFFLPLEGSQPAIGTQNEIQKVAEVKIEFICPQKLIKTVLKAIRKVHPYEEIAFDVIPLLNYQMPPQVETP